MVLNSGDFKQNFRNDSDEFVVDVFMGFLVDFRFLLLERNRYFRFLRSGGLGEKGFGCSILLKFQKTWLILNRHSVERGRLLVVLGVESLIVSVQTVRWPGYYVTFMFSVYPLIVSLRQISFCAGKFEFSIDASRRWFLCPKSDLGWTLHKSETVFILIFKFWIFHKLRIRFIKSFILIKWLIVEEVVFSLFHCASGVFVWWLWSVL